MYSPQDTVISDLSQILLLPLRLECHGDLRDQRQNARLGHSAWLSAAAGWIAEQSGGAWRRVGDLYSDLGLFDEAAGYAVTTEADRYSFAVYFHPFIRDLFLHPSQKPVEVLQHTQAKWAEVVTRRGDGGEYPSRLFRIRRLHLFLFPADIAMFTLQIDWHKENKGETLFLAETQDLLNQFRRLYPPYFKKGKNEPGDVPVRVQWRRERAREAIWGLPSDYANEDFFCDYVRQHRVPPIAAHWQSLLNPLTQGEGNGKNNSVKISQIVDDRIPSMVYAAVNPVQGVSESDLARLVFLDGSSTEQEFAYAPEFLGKMRRYRYDRFWSPDPPEKLTTRYFCCGYNFLVLVSSNDGFATAVLRKHFDRHYFFLGLLAWLQKASLLAFWRRLAVIVHKYSNEETSRASRERFFERQKWLLDDISDFVTRFHFDEVSNQLQALELFRWWSRHLGTARLYSMVIEQTKFLGDLQFNHWQAQVQTASARLQSVATYWVPASIACGFLGFLGLALVEGLVRHSGRMPEKLGFSPLELLLYGLAALLAASILFWSLLWLLHPSLWSWLSGRLRKPRL